MYEVLEGYVTSDGRYYKNKEVAEQKEMLLEIRKYLDQQPFPVGANTGIGRTLQHIEEHFTLVRKTK